MLVLKDTIRLYPFLRYRPYNYRRSKLSNLYIRVSIPYTFRTFRSNRIYS